eukprot:133318-Pyramimonas_sp.AAC.1
MESLSTLKFVNRAKNIKNNAHINEDVDQAAEDRSSQLPSSSGLVPCRPHRSGRSPSPSGPS